MINNYVNCIIFGGEGVRMRVAESVRVRVRIRMAQGVRVRVRVRVTQGVRVRLAESVRVRVRVRVAQGVRVRLAESVRVRVKVGCWSLEKYVFFLFPSFHRWIRKPVFIKLNREKCIFELLRHLRF
jgi:hypothetical protein